VKNTISNFRSFLLKSTLLLLLLIAYNSQLLAQDSSSIKLSATVDTNTILIGSQFKLEIQLEQPNSVKSNWPEVADTFALFEIVSRSRIDTVSNGAILKRKQQFVVTSFDSGYHVIPPFVASYSNGSDTAVQTVESLPILITVNTVPVDTTKSIKDLKSQVDVPLTWKDFLPFILAALAIAIICYFLYRYFRNRKRGVKEPVINVPVIPPHEIALRDLKELDEQKLWQQGNFKGYFTRLSDITRIFIENKWSVPAMEMTTDEIMHLNIIQQQDKELNVKLKQLLEFADLVKFAKAIPVSYECENAMKQALDFVKRNIEIERSVETK
jgi:hypothetical protein